MHSICYAPRYIEKIMYLEKPKRPIIWKGGSNNLAKLIISFRNFSYNLSLKQAKLIKTFDAWWFMPYGIVFMQAVSVWIVV
jgi:hypothetical protein